ncbi:MAG TPA: 3-isopropylmalate dehydratase large subunit [Anaerovoracaceae bacterium]|nr:3-isopropylmalate dehydratase large subunit [Anaerovoracaceae bacterium]
MAQTITEKILSAHAGRDVKVNEIVEVEPDLIMVHEGIGWGIKAVLDDIGVEGMAYPERIVTVLDHYAPPPNAEAAELQRVSRNYALKYFPQNFHDIRSGICHQVMVERYVKPGQVVVGSDSHTTTYGAFGCFASGLGFTDVALAMANGRTWFKVPETIAIELKGQLPRGVEAKDLMLYLFKELGTDGATYMVCEFLGEGLKTLSMESRICLCNMSAELGAKAAVIGVDDVTRSYLSWLGRKIDETKIFASDQNADYHRRVTVDLSSLTPLVAKPHSPENVCGVEAVADVRVDQVFIGGCVNGRIEDMRAAAEILRGGKLAERTRLIVVPASHKVMKQMAAEGILDVFLDIGAAIAPSTCGPCFGGHFGMLADHEVCVSTATRNFVGRMGSKLAGLYLASPQTAAATALKGTIADPRELL